MSKNKIYLKAYFRKNLGDDMFVRCIAERYPATSFKICTSSVYAQPFENLPNISNLSWICRFIDRVCNRMVGAEICKKQLEKSADATVHIGGSIFIEPDNFVPPQAYLSNSNLFMIGCNFGPYKTEAYRDFIFSRLQKANDVCFRDKYSYDVFSSIPHARVAPDVLFGYPHYPVPQSGCGVGISVISPDVRPELKHIADTYYSVVAQTIDLYAQSAVPVTLFSFCADEGDTQAIHEIKTRCVTDKFEICKYDGDIDVFLRNINACEYIIASRFHAMIIGWCLGKKVFPIVYSDKQLHVMEDVQYSGACWDLRKADAYTANKLIDSVYASQSFPVDEFTSESQRQFKMTDKFLGSL